MNTADIIVAATIAAILALAVVLYIKKRKKGGCSCDCGSCGLCTERKKNGGERGEG